MKKRTHFQWIEKWSFSERRSNFSLDLRQIRPSVVFGTRRRTALRGEGFAWVPDLGSFLKLREVWVSPYLGFTLYLSVFMMLELFEALNGHLIGPNVRPPPFVTTSWVPFRWKLTHRISSFPLSSFRLPRDSNLGPRVFSPMGSISGTN